MTSALTAHDANILGTLLSNDDLNQQQPTVSSLGLHGAQRLNISTQEHNAVMRLNSASPSHQSILESIADFDAIVERGEASASTYVNRAQACRLLVADGDLFTKENIRTIEAILQDLEKAIVSSPADQHPTTALEAPNDPALGAAYTHKGFILLCASQASKAGALDLSEVPALRDYNLERLEVAVNQAFTDGGRFGNLVGRQMAVKTNPYAKMCGSILKQAMRQEQAMV